MNADAGIALGSLVVAIIVCVIAARSYKKSKRLEFFQRRDQLFAKISDLNAKNSEAHLISAKYEIVAVKNASLGLSGEQAEKHTAIIAAIKEIRKNMEKSIKNWDESIQHLHAMCSSLTPKTDTARVENLIAMVQAASDDLKKYNDASLSSLHILENTNSIIKVSLAEFDEKVRQIDLDLRKAIKGFNEKSPE
ncbi:MAG: hypothetical protein H0W34_10785 [Pyrinomonadaceae bacterium]|nr:hypothetical protein [Gammaproteobacteria bacterium]MBA3572435.1 hypothetical protein [Pyrinomonadaceae bacterium]